MLLDAVLALEALDAPRGIDQPLLSSVKRVAARAYLDVKLAERRAGFEGVSARAGHHAAAILWMNSGFHLDRSELSDCYEEYHQGPARTIRPSRNRPRLSGAAALAAAALSIAIWAPSPARGADPATRAPAALASPAPAAPPRGFAPAAQTIFAPVLELAPPGPNRAARAIAALDRRLVFQRAISFHPKFGAALQKVIDEMPPRQSTLIRAAALYSRDDIPWTDLPGAVHQISVAGRLDGANYLYTLTPHYFSPEVPGRMGGFFALKPVGGSADGNVHTVTGQLGGEVLLDSYGGGALIDVVGAILRQIRGDLRPPWDTAPGRFNRHDQASLARFHRDMPALAAKLDHFVEFHNVLDEFDSPSGPIVLFNLDCEIRTDALKPFPHLYDFYSKLAPVLEAQSSLTDGHGHYWLRTRFDHGRIRVIFMDRDGMLAPFDANLKPAGAPIALGALTRGSYRTDARVAVTRLGMQFGLGNLGFISDYSRDGDSVTVRTRMDRVPELLAPPGIHKIIDLIAGHFLATLAQGEGGLTTTLASRRQGDRLFRVSLAMTGEFAYSPTLEFLARIGDAIAEQHNATVRAEEREVGEQLFDAFVSDYNGARPRILALDSAQYAHQP
jgi:hypothetical protein